MAQWYWASAVLVTQRGGTLHGLGMVLRNAWPVIQQAEMNEDAKTLLGGADDNAKRCGVAARRYAKSFFQRSVPLCAKRQTMNTETAFKVGRIAQSQQTAITRESISARSEV